MPRERESRERESQQNSSIYAYSGEFDQQGHQSWNSSVWRSSSNYSLTLCLSLTHTYAHVNSYFQGGESDRRGHCFWNSSVWRSSRNYSLALYLFFTHTRTQLVFFRAENPIDQDIAFGTAAAARAAASSPRQSS